MATPRPATLGELTQSGWRSRSVRDELRENLAHMLREGTPVEARWPGILGYTETVLPQVETAILSRHDFILLGLRGQAKTRILRSLKHFLDEWMPAIAGTPLREDPLAPLSSAAQRRIAEEGDDLPIEWIHRDERYHEKLATPDVTVADLIGESSEANTRQSTFANS